MGTLSEKLQDLLDEAVQRRRIAGGNLLVLKDGKEISYVQSGFADVEQGIPYSRDTLARLYSMTKPVTAAAAMLLVQRGQLDLGQSLGEILPFFSNMQVWEKGVRVPARRNILVKDLLNMTSGLSYPGGDEAGQEAAAVFDRIDSALYGNAPLTTMEVARQLGGCTLAFHPGEKWMYGTSADILGAVIEQVSGMPFGAFLKKELFEPLNMTDTDFYVPSPKQHRLAQTYELTPGGLGLCPTNNLGIAYTQHRPPAFESGGAGLVSTVDDYAQFARMLLGLGEKQLLRPQTLAFMTQTRLLPWQRDSLWHSWESMYGYTYGSLMRILEEPGMALLQGWKGEYGWDGWLGCYFCNSPSNGVSVIMTCQRKDAGTMELTRKLRNVISAYIQEEV